jgi:hypothetical protein
VAFYITDFLQRIFYLPGWDAETAPLELPQEKSDACHKLSHAPVNGKTVCYPNCVPRSPYQLKICTSASYMQLPYTHTFQGFSQYQSAVTNGKIPIMVM